MKNLSSEVRPLTQAEKRLALFAAIFGLPVLAGEGPSMRPLGAAAFRRRRR